MSERTQSILLVDPPTFPRGVLSLSLPMVAALLRDRFEPRIVDLNFLGSSRWGDVLDASPAPILCGLKVSAQNARQAAEFSGLVRRRLPNTKIVWGGELPTLLPEECLKHADCAVRGRFEPSAGRFADDLAAGRLERIYEASSPARFNGSPPPALDLVEHPGRYLRFMGTPLETSLGCSESCTFCMVRTMQKGRDARAPRALAEDLASVRRDFVNVVDYNAGDSKEHILSVAESLGASEARGWMAETCIENLDDDEVLSALARSRCRMVYCGLESLSPESLRFVNKTQNDAASYRRIISKAQGAGVDVASGFILGLEGTSRATFTDFADFADEAGLIYLKLTYLTFNPGDKAKAAMARKGRYVSEEIESYDGHHLTFLPEGLRPEVVFDGARTLIERFYSFPSLLRRSRHLASDWRRRAEFMLFSYCYGQAYRDWLAHDILTLSGGGFDGLLRRPMRKGFGLSLAEAALEGLRGTA